MELGQRIRQARLEAGLSQRQLCQGLITRNMLSLLEHGTARPSVETLQALAQRLGKPVSYFLEESAVISPNLPVIRAAREQYQAGNFEDAAKILRTYREPDPIFDPEFGLLAALNDLALAKQAAGGGRIPYALELLERAGSRKSLYGFCTERERRLLLAELSPENSENLPSMDRELMILASSALKNGEVPRAGALLDSCKQQESPRWNLLRGICHELAQGWQAAVPCLQAAENAFPEQALPRLEHCFRMLEDYRMAYEYACRQREKP